VLVQVAAIGDHAGTDLLCAFAQFGNGNHRAYSFHILASRTVATPW
jgi:hypothetical protein